MPKRKLSTVELLRRIDAGESYSEIARDYGVSKQAIFGRFRRLRPKTTRVVVANSKKMEAVVDRKIDAISQLHTINKKTLELLDKAEEDPTLALKCIAEVRCQLKLSLEIFETLYSLRQVEHFMNTVLEVIDSVDQAVAKKNHNAT